jgi:ATP-dependent DNA helicase RecG
MHSLDHETNKAMLVQHIRNQGNMGAPLPDLQQVLPSLSARAVQRLLRELRDEGRIAARGERRWTHWVVSSVKDI